MCMVWPWPPHSHYLFTVLPQSPLQLSDCGHASETKPTLSQAVTPLETSSFDLVQRIVFLWFPWVSTKSQETFYLWIGKD